MTDDRRQATSGATLGSPDPGRRAAPRWLRTALVALCLLAAFLRLHALGFHPLWWDEGNSLYFGLRGPAEHVRLSRLLGEVNPPVYRWTLGLWTLVAGAAPFALRFVSVTAGLVTVALTWAGGRRVLGWRVATVGALLMALAPMQIQYSQEAKGYAFEQAALLAATALWLWLATPPPLTGRNVSRVAGWVAYGLCIAVALGTHYLAVFLLLAQGIWTLLRAPLLVPGTAPRAIRLNPEWLRVAVPHTAAVLLGALLQLPWLAATAGGTTRGLAETSVAREGVVTYGPLAYLGHFGTEFAVGETGPAQPVLSALAVLLLAGLVLLGAVALARAARRDGRASTAALVVLTWAGLPVLLGYVFQSRFPFFYPRFLLYVTPALALLAAQGLVALWDAQRVVARGAAAALLCAQAGLAAMTLMPLYTTPVLHGEDWRPLLAQIRPYVRSGDTVISTFIWVEGYFHSYLEGVRPEFVLGFYSPDNVDRQMAPLAARRARVWLVNYGTTSDDPNNLAAHWLNRHAARVRTFATEAAEIVLYAWPPPALPATPETVFRFGDHLELHTMPGAPVGDNAVIYQLTWQAVSPISADLRIYLHVLGPDGQLLAGADGLFVNGLAPASSLEPGHPVQELRGILLPASLPPDYRITLGVYDVATGSRWHATDDRGNLLGDEIGMPRPDAPSPLRGP